MDKKALFDILKDEPAETVLAVLDSVYDVLSAEQRDVVFGRFMPQHPIDPPSIVTAEHLAAVKQFHDESLAGVYYAAFNMNSSNYSNIPKKTNKWFDTLGDLLLDTVVLSEREEHGAAVTAFTQLHDLIERIDRGEEIVFAHELGSWMIPVDENGVLDAYVTSLAVEKTAEAYAENVVPLLKRDSYSSFYYKMYARVIKMGNEEQKAAVEAIIKEKNIRIEPRKR